MGNAVGGRDRPWRSFRLAVVVMSARHSRGSSFPTTDRGGCPLFDHGEVTAGRQGAAEPCPHDEGPQRGARGHGSSVNDQYMRVFVFRPIIAAIGQPVMAQTPPVMMVRKR